MSEFKINPYDFQQPVLQRNRFAGRSAQLRDIEYYLDQAQYTRPTNLAIVGPRAAGKTSLLNMIAQGAADRGMVAVRINFSEDHGKSQLQFFFKIFDSLVNEVLKHRRASDGERAFGGRGGSFMQAYTRAIATHEQGDWGDMEIVFPNLYAAAMKAGKLDSPVPQAFFEDDLRRISDEVGKPIVLLMDECNVFIQNREILQAMRGMFQALDRYMLVMVGTDQMFPVIDDVYSPVGRGFKRIALEGFSDLADTWACMERPCVAHGVPREILRAFRPSGAGLGVEEFPDELKALHQFTSGNPHEIQLVCHFMFKALQAQIAALGARDVGELSRLVGAAPRLSLGPEVIQRVLEELSPDEERQRVLKQVKKLSPKALVALSVLGLVGFGLRRAEYAALLRCDRELGGLLGHRLYMAGRSPEVAKDPDFSEVAKDPGVRAIRIGLITPNRFDEGLDELLRIGWIEEAVAGNLDWRADPLKEILIKYVARSEGVSVGGFSRRAINGQYMRSLVSQSKPFAKFGPYERVFGESGGVCDRVPERLRALLGDGLWVLQVDLTLEGGERCSAASIIPGSADGRAQVLAELESRVSRANEEGALAGIRWRLIREDLSAEKPWTGSTDDWLFCFEKPELLRSRLVMVPWLQGLCKFYMDGNDVRSVMQRAAAAAELLSPEVLPNLGYMALAVGVDGARAILNRAAEHVAGSLISYNQALSFLLGPEPDVKTASERLSQVFADDRDDFLVVLRLRCNADSIEMFEHKPSDPSGPKRVGELVLEALAELKKVVAGVPVVRVARPNGVSE